MSAVPQALTFERGGTLVLDLADKPTNATVTIRTGDGGVRCEDQSATVDAQTTTLSAAASAGDMSISVADATNIANRNVLTLTDDHEPVLVKSVSGTTVALRRPLVYDHAFGAAVESTRVSFAVNSAVSGALWWDGSAEWLVDGADVYHTAVHCTRYPLARLATLQDLADVEPRIGHIMDERVDHERALDAAHRFVLSELAKASPFGRVHVFPGADGFTRATALAALYLHYHIKPGDQAAELSERLMADLAREIDAIAAALPRDSDQDRVVTVDEKMSSRSGRLYRG